MMLEPFSGYWGKLPAHGDFLRAGFPENVLMQFDRWVSNQLREAKERHGERFEEIWHGAPSWNFIIRAGMLDPKYAITGIWMPSIDAVGRCFPFVFAIMHDPEEVMFRMLPPYESVLRQAIEHTQTIDTLEDHLSAVESHPPSFTPKIFDTWWQSGRDGATLNGALPSGTAFDWLLEAIPLESQNMSEVEGK
ncbi:type VI secretion system-associated protein TagF [Swingsia samuiensis]|nr:type VI secretion system-associated protein TagF [Swingsia samuiensis]